MQSFKSGHQAESHSPGQKSGRHVSLDQSISVLCKDIIMQHSLLAVMSMELDENMTNCQMNKLLDETDALFHQFYAEKYDRIALQVQHDHLLGAVDTKYISSLADLRGRQFGTACIIRLARTAWNARYESERLCREYGVSELDAALLVQTVTQNATRMEVTAMEMHVLKMQTEFPRRTFSQTNC
jgi:hypothetical protein